MASASVHGSKSSLQLDAHELGPNITNTQVQRGNDVHDKTGYGQTAHTFAAGLANGKITIQGWWDKNATTGSYTQMKAYMVGPASTAVAWIWAPEGTTTGNVKISGSGFIEDYTESSPVADIVTFSATLQISGAVTDTVF